MHFTTILVLFLVGPPIEGGPDYLGTEFLVMFGENKIWQQDYMLELFVTTISSDMVFFNVSTPKWVHNDSVNMELNVTSGQVRQILLPQNLRHFGCEKSTKGLWISATDEVAVYGVNKQKYSCDGFVGLPTDVLGKQYYTVTYSPAKRSCQFGIVATEDNTNINVTLGHQQHPVGSATNVAYEGVNYGNGDVMRMVLNRFETIQIQASNEYDLTGSYIDADKPVAVFSGNLKTNVGDGNSQDHLVEQLMPVESWGKRFATVPIPGRDIFKLGDVFRFVASVANTTITITGISDQGTQQLNLPNAGSFIEYVIGFNASNTYTLIESNHPILVVQIVQSQVKNTEPADPSMILIPPVEQYASEYAFTTPKYSLGSYENYLMLIAKSSEASGIRLNGVPLGNDTIWHTIPGTDYQGATVLVAEGTHVINHVSPISLFGVFMFGTANFETYGFPGGMRMAPINTFCVPSTMVGADGFDNDCDGRIDEELCDNNIDDDNDGLQDEDCANEKSTVITTTDKAPTTTVEAAITTLESPTTNTKEQSTTTEKPPTTTEALITTSKTVTTTTKAASTTSQSATTTTTVSPTTHTGAATTTTQSSTTTTTVSPTTHTGAATTTTQSLTTTTTVSPTTHTTTTQSPTTTAPVAPTTPPEAATTTTQSPTTGSTLSPTTHAGAAPANTQSPTYTTIVPLTTGKPTEAATNTTQSTTSTTTVSPTKSTETATTTTQSPKTSATTGANALTMKRRGTTTDAVAPTIEAATTITEATAATFETQTTTTGAAPTNTYAPAMAAIHITTSETVAIPTSTVEHITTTNAGLSSTGGSFETSTTSQSLGQGNLQLRLMNDDGTLTTEGISVITVGSAAGVALAVGGGCCCFFMAGKLRKRRTAEEEEEETEDHGLIDDDGGSVTPRSESSQSACSDYSVVESETPRRTLHLFRHPKHKAVAAAGSVDLRRRSSVTDVDGHGHKTGKTISFFRTPKGSFLSRSDVSLNTVSVTPSALRGAVSPSQISLTTSSSMSNVEQPEKYYNDQIGW